MPEYNIDDIVAGAQRQQLEAQLEEQLNGLRVNHNVPVDHDLFRLFFEALNPNMNVNELNDDDVAALQEQMNEILDGGHLPDQEGEGEWQQDWNSDEEWLVHHTGIDLLRIGGVTCLSCRDNSGVGEHCTNRLS